MKPELQCGERCSGNCEYNCGDVEAAYEAGLADGAAQPRKKLPLYKVIANALIARRNCREAGNHEWAERWQERLGQLDKLLPSGSGFDNGSVVVKVESDERKIVIETSFHHMNDNGAYGCWTEHRVIVESDMTGIRIKVTGRDHREVKDYIGELFHNALTEEIEQYPEVQV
jgi:hypothetical protein